MFNLISMKKKEVPEELQRTEIIFDIKLKELDDFSDPNKFLLAEKNGIPYYTHITSNNIMNSNNNHICFIDLDENLKLTPKNIEIIDKDVDKNSLSRVSSILYNLPLWKKINDFFKFDSTTLNDINNPDVIAKTHLLKKKDIKIMKLNTIGSIIALINKNNFLILSNIETKKVRLYNLRSINQFYEKSDTLTANEIVDIEWHPVNRDILAIIFKKRIIFFKISEDLECMHKKTLKNFKNITNFKWDPSAQYSIIISNNCNKFSLIDSNFKTLYSKNYLSLISNDSSIIWANNSSYFIIYDKSSLYLYNTINLSFKSWTDFKGNINNVIITDNNDYILIFTDDEMNPMYILYNIEEDFYNLSNYNSYNNIARYFLHWNFQVAYKNFCFKFSDKKVIVKSRLNESNNRLVVLYKDIISSKYDLKLFGVEFTKSIQEINIYPICSLSKFRDYDLIEFELYYNYYEKEDVLIILWDDKYLSKTYLNATDLKIN